MRAVVSIVGMIAFIVFCVWMANRPKNEALEAIITAMKKDPGSWEFGVAHKYYHHETLERNGICVVSGGIPILETKILEPSKIKLTFSEKRRLRNEIVKLRRKMLYLQVKKVL